MHISEILWLILDVYDHLQLCNCFWPRFHIFRILKVCYCQDGTVEYGLKVKLPCENENYPYLIIMKSLKRVIFRGLLILCSICEVCYVVGFIVLIHQNWISFLQWHLPLLTNSVCAQSEACELPSQKFSATKLPATQKDSWRAWRYRKSNNHNGTFHNHKQLALFPYLYTAPEEHFQVSLGLHDEVAYGYPAPSALCRIRHECVKHRFCVQHFERLWDTMSSRYREGALVSLCLP